MDTKQIEKGKEKEPYEKAISNFIDDSTPEKKTKLSQKKKTKAKISKPKVMMMKKGMPIHFYGCKYKVIRVRDNGRVVLQFKGFIGKGMVKS